MVWLDDVLHPLDVSDALEVRGAVTSTVGSGNGSYGLSACTGETRMRQVVGKDAHVYYGVFHVRAGKAGRPISISEHVADQATVAGARKKYRAIVRQVSACQHEPAGHWTYGVAHRTSNKVGTSTWMTTSNGNGARAGGIIVARTGRHLAVVELTGAPTSRQLGQLTAGTVSELR